MRTIKPGIILITVTILLIPGIGYTNIVNSLGLGGGVFWPPGGWDPGFTINAQADLGEVLKYLYLSPYVNYAHASKMEDMSGDSENLTTQYLNLGAKLLGYINSKPEGFFIGGAISYNTISYDEIDWTEYDFNTRIVNRNTNKIGFTGLTGYLFMLQKMSIFVEVHYMLAAGGFNNLSAITGININI